MKVQLSTLLCIGLLSASMTAPAQQSGTTSAPNATATPAPAAQTPATAQAPAATELPAADSTTAAAPPAQPANTDSYVIGPDDSIQVMVWKEPTLTGTFPVRPDGMISLALVGDIAAAGRTPMELSNDLTNRLKKFITDPTVTVSVMAVNSKRIFMLGEVAHIGPLPLTSSMSPLQAIAAAGGLTPYANKSHIYILRGEQGKQKKIPFDYKKAIKNGDMQGVTLFPGDTIVVP